MISVVTAVYNGAALLEETLASILGQEGCRLEFIVVDDGSTDTTPAILASWAARDSRLRVATQGHTGLTRALIRGCEMATGEFIARHDVGDNSLPGRLRAQADLLTGNAELVLAGCHYMLVGPAREPLNEPVPREGAMPYGLTNRDGRKFASPHHGTVMFRKAAYLAAGGYRPAFYFAQDADLWSRLIEHGDYGCVERTLYEVRFEPGSITARHRGAQEQLRRLLQEAAALRRAGRSEAAILKQAAAIRPADGARGVAQTAQACAAAAYFVGSCLARRNDPRARKYLLQVLRHNPFHIKSWYKLGRLLLNSRAPAP